MSAATQWPTVRGCAKALIDAVEEHGDDREALIAAIKAPIAELARHPGLLELGIPRQGNNVASSQYLYFDGQLSILIFELPKGKTIPPHDHGVWEAFCVYRGQVRHKVFLRVDDRSVEGYAELDTVDDCELTKGDVVIVAPPADIHSFTALEEGTLGITVVNGAYSGQRHYYQPESNSYVVKKPSNPH